MQVFQHDNLWAIAHAGKVIAKRFISESEAWAWADHNVDDQMFDGPNEFSPPLEYEPDLIARVVRVEKGGSHD